MPDFIKIDRINKLAKALKDSGLASSFDIAVKKAEQRIDEEKETLNDMQKADFAGKVEDAVEGLKGRIGGIASSLKEKIHIGEEKSGKIEEKSDDKIEDASAKLEEMKKDIQQKNKKIEVEEE